MKTFNGQEIKMPKQPMPKVNQIWEDNFGNFFKVNGITESKVQASIEYENGRKMLIGFAWFDGITYRFIGTI